MLMIYIIFVIISDEVKPIRVNQIMRLPIREKSR